MKILIIFIFFLYVIKIVSSETESFQTNVVHIEGDENDSSPEYKYTRSANDDDDVVGGIPKKRQKRFIYFFCMNYPDCCDFRGKDVCGYPCPVCPKKKPPPPLLDSCQYFKQQGSQFEWSLVLIVRGHSKNMC